ncbi:competence protein ComEC [Enemella dayhoffiae]|uniref:Competence protein ComEC n=1 Tax=Enemella dayhoffiae TaxID=2016507 RepID=A0A255GZF0_9ACTN|nr:ComEC/Rec2 family competence protein [Enemella dayhoffiae]OYO21008.1 competence protein ComEC [Enemella dayhoffiae]
MATVDARLIPVAVTAWGATLVGTAAGGVPVAVLAAASALAAAVLALIRKPLLAATALALLVLLATSWARQQQLDNSPLRRLAEQRAVAVLDVTVGTDPQSVGSRFGGQTVMLSGDAVRASGRGHEFGMRQPVRVFATGGNAEALRSLPVGATVRVLVQLGSPDPGEPFAAIASLRGTPETVSHPGPGSRAVDAVRAGLRDAVAELPAEQRALVPALVVGDTSLMTDRLREDFRTTGLVHLTAVSGANLTLLLAFLLTAARLLGVRGRWLHLVGLIGVAVFVTLCRTEPSVLRAAAMGLVALAALGSNAESGKGIRHLSLAVIALLLSDPWLGRSLGFALSVLASGGIILLAARWRDRLIWLPRPVAEAVTVPLAAQLATQPLVTAISGQVSMVGLLANALAGPFVGPATVLGFATAGLAVPLPWLAGFTGWLAGWSAQAILWISHAGAGLPGAAWQWPAGPVGVLVVLLACLAAIPLIGWLLERRWLVLLTAALLVVVISRPQATPGWPPRDWLLVACDVGQGDAVVLNAGGGQAVLVDTGPAPAPLAACLDQLGVRALPLLVLTHYHADHAGGLDAVAGPTGVRRPLGQLLVSPLGSPPGAAAAIRQRADALGVPVRVAAPGQQLRIGEISWRTIGPVRTQAAAVAGGNGESSAENDSSVVAVAELGGIRVLLTGDAEPAAQQAILASGADLRADVLKVAHHGSARQDEGFVTASGARVALISVGADNDYGHPAARTLQLLGRHGQQVLRTDRQGAVALTCTAGRLAAHLQRPKEPR